jgi:demethylmenaquinone methyltransferase/2-methoxy-6-polyprenyl-1,4-benzoquinol methylase
MIILDAGIGPGTMSQTILQQTTQLTIVGLDASLRLLDAARERLKTNHSDHLHLIRGVFEALPFKERSFSRIVSAYAFRDARNRRAAIDEFHRVGSENSIFAIVDLGKPENRINRSLISFYVRNVMPFIARLVMSGSVEGNPWRMIFPTYQALGSNRELVEALSKLFNDVILREFALGGAIVVLARRTDSNLQQK